MNRPSTKRVCVSGQRCEQTSSSTRICCNILQPFTRFYSSRRGISSRSALTILLQPHLLQRSTSHHIMNICISDIINRQKNCLLQLKVAVVFLCMAERHSLLPREVIHQRKLAATLARPYNQHQAVALPSPTAPKAVWTCAADVVSQNFWWGTGTGDAQDALQQAYEARQFYFAR